MKTAESIIEEALNSSDRLKEELKYYDFIKDDLGVYLWDEEKQILRSLKPGDYPISIWYSIQEDRIKQTVTDLTHNKLDSDKARQNRLDRIKAS